MAGIEDVAKLAGVSTATVSRALSGKDHVSAKARAKVESAAAELGYVASSSAYTLATGRTRNIAVVMPFVDRWYFSKILESIETELIEQGYDLTLYNLSGGLSQRNKIFNDFLMRKRADGVITVAVKLTDVELNSLTRTNKPLFGIGGLIPGARALTIDDTAVGRLATEHLISLGHTKIACVGGVKTSEMDFSQPTRRRNGWEQALKDAGLQVHSEWFVASDFTIAGAYNAVKQILGDPNNNPTAVFCISDEMAFGAIMAAKDLGLRVPQDISIIGVDDHDYSEFFGLTTISQSVQKQGAKVVRLLLELFEKDELDGQVNVEKVELFPIELIVRSSTARPAALSR